MCFSAPASFAAAAVIGAIGAATLAQRPARKRLAFAAIPAIFALHQTIEGYIWLALSSGGPPPDALLFAYLFIAQVFWPTYTPLAVLLLERDRRRRWALMILLAGGLIVSGALFSNLLTAAHFVEIIQHSLHYSSADGIEGRFTGLYVLTTTAPLLISRHRYIMAFGGAVLISSVITELAFHHAAASVWCFFAAIASAFVFLHIRRQAYLAVSDGER